jgi:hypothetical protein
VEALPSECTFWHNGCVKHAFACWVASMHACMRGAENLQLCEICQGLPSSGAAMTGDRTMTGSAAPCAPPNADGKGNEDAAFWDGLQDCAWAG